MLIDKPLFELALKQQKLRLNGCKQRLERLKLRLTEHQQSSLSRPWRGDYQSRLPHVPSSNATVADEQVPGELTKLKTHTTTRRWRRKQILIMKRGGSGLLFTSCERRKQLFRWCERCKRRRRR
eukprot:GHVS01034154.1.p1 GENE.GHVS01034154.1~~GHVS01034154.1.p1  ORF type:complete len:124 (-),score=22.05 GHVS01034154.1:121-492(-)